jgi:hypothetical protein
MDQITIRAFRAIDEPGTCSRYVNEHVRVLEDFGVTQVIRNDEWVNDPHCHVLIAEHPSLGLVGGIKVMRALPGRSLPMQTAIHSMDPRIEVILSELESEGNAEVCGLWNSNGYAGRGIPLLLSIAAVSLANQLGLHTMCCFVAHYTLRHALKAGFTVMDGVGDGGTFTYPIPDIRSIAMVIPDVITLDMAMPAFRERILSLRLRPEQNRVECPSGIDLDVKYELLLDHKILDLHAYRSIQRQKMQYQASA